MQGRELEREIKTIQRQLARLHCVVNGHKDAPSEGLINALIEEARPQPEKQEEIAFVSKEEVADLHLLRITREITEEEFSKRLRALYDRKEVA